MQRFSFLVACGLAIIRPLTAQFLDTRDALIPLQVQRELSLLLSHNSTIIGPSDADWANETERYNDVVQPHVQLVVQPGLESDIPKIVSILTSSADGESFLFPPSFPLGLER